jgi:3-hydroxyacyl-CoA dehydrogenase/3a,7a,12a-trihydroxy-5b-cholest-24-enoyl-CoA hydratase
LIFFKNFFFFIVRDSWSDITSFEKPIYHTSIGESTNYALNMLEDSKKDGVEQKDQLFSYNHKDAILYALSINMSTNGDLKFLYENHPDFSVFPTFGVIPAQESIFGSISSFELPKGVTIDLTRLLHGEHYLELFKPFSSAANLRRDYKLVDVLDKGSGASLIFNGNIFTSFLNFQNYYFIFKLNHSMIKTKKSR